MSVRCTICHRDLPKSAFYPTYLKRYQYQCKECVRKQNKQYQKDIKDIPYKDFDRFYGGYIVSILNYPSPHRYTIKGTNGVLICTNDSDEFINKIKDIIGRYTE